MIRRLADHTIAVSIVLFVVIVEIVIVHFIFYAIVRIICVVLVDLIEHFVQHVVVDIHFVVRSIRICIAVIEEAISC